MFWLAVVFHDSIFLVYRILVNITACEVVYATFEREYYTFSQDSHILDYGLQNDARGSTQTLTMVIIVHAPTNAQTSAVMQ